MEFKGIKDIDEFLKLASLIDICDGFRGMTKKEAIQTIEQGYAIPTTPLQQLPLDPDVIEYTFATEIENYAGDDLDVFIDDLVKSIIPWYNGTISSIKNGLNLTTFDNAVSFSDKDKIIVGYEVNGELVSFGDYYFYAKDADTAIPKVVIYANEEYSPEEFLKIVKEG